MEAIMNHCLNIFFMTKDSNNFSFLLKIFSLVVLLLMVNLKDRVFLSDQSYPAVKNSEVNIEVKPSDNHIKTASLNEVVFPHMHVIK